MRGGSSFWVEHLLASDLLPQGMPTDGWAIDVQQILDLIERRPRPPASYISSIK